MSCTESGRTGSCIDARAHEDGRVCIGAASRRPATFFPGALTYIKFGAPLILVSHLAQRGQPPVPKDERGMAGRRPRPELRRLPVERGAADGALRDWKFHRRVRRAVPHFVAPAADPLRHRDGLHGVAGSRTAESASCGQATAPRSEGFLFFRTRRAE